jgi:hypothetical protein
MRENSGSGQGGRDSRDPTLNENAGTRPEGSGGGTPGANTDFDVAADHDPEGGKRSPSARGRGEVTDSSDVEPNNS